MRVPRLVALLTLTTGLVFLTAPATQAAQICGCQRITTGRINRITAIPPGVAPTCRVGTHVLLCWPDQASAGTVTSITAGNGLDATPNPITGVGTIFVDAPMCSASTNKLLWDGSAFVCAVDQDQPPADVSARVFRSANLTVPRGVGVAIDFDQERWDTDNTHDPGASADCTQAVNRCRLTAQTAGKYHIYGHVRWAVPSDSTASVREVGIRLNGGGFIASDRRGDALGDQVNQSVSTHYELNPGDYVELEVHHTALPSTLDVVADAGLSPEFGMVKLP